MSGMLNRDVGGRYLLQEELGRGAHGIVYRAWDSVRKGPVALKLFTGDDDVDVQAAEAARHFEVIEGSAILPLYEVHPEFPEGQVTVMPLMPATLADEQTVFASRAVYVTRRILTGLEFCHGRQVIHGDVKPSNAFVDPRGAVLLGDFGVAGWTTEYASPELLAGHPKDVAADLWATAVTFYELLCGEMPFGQEPDLDASEVATRIQSCAYPHPDDIQPFLPLRFRQFFRRCFVADPAQRPWRSAGEMRSALGELSVCVEWCKMRRSTAVVLYEGHEISRDAHRTGVTFEASITARPRKRDYVAQVRKAPAGGTPRNLRGLQQFAGSKKQAAQKLSVWMRTLTDIGDVGR
jgi:serine/threonine protein kinase